MACRLGYVEPDRTYDPWRIAWYCDGDLGSVVGDEYDASQEEPDRALDLDGWERWAHDRAAAPFAMHTTNYIGGFLFEDYATARRAMKAIKAALTAKRPLLDWEAKALAANWTPPKGWTGAT